MEWLFEPQAWVALATLTALEIMLGIDNIICISVLVSRPPERRQKEISGQVVFIDPLALNWAENYARW